MAGLLAWHKGELQMIIVGELINTSRKSVAEAVARRDAEAIKELAKSQADFGAAYIDVNCGTFLEEEEELLPWLVKTVQEAVEIPLCLDSPNPKALERALEVHQGLPLLNSISGEQERFEQVLPLVQESGASVIALCMDDEGIGGDSTCRLQAGQKLGQRLLEAGIGQARIFFDPLLRPVATESDAGQVALETIWGLRQAFPKSHIICGLSNISFGLPNRRLLNRTFLSLAAARGLDSAILDPTDPQMRYTLAALATLLGEDDFCMNYLSFIREQEGK
jgi:cobalamin-dependent methionine synthase I